MNNCTTMARNALPRRLSTYPIPPLILSKLQDVGYLHVRDVSNIKISELSQVAGITAKEALDVMELVFVNPAGGSYVSTSSVNRKTAWELLQEEQSEISITTFSEKIDYMLDGGVAMSKLTEVCGAPGVGKTQLCLQLCVNIQIPTCFGGAGGQAVFIDTEGSFMVGRVEDMAQACVNHCRSIALTENTPECNDVAQQFTVKSILCGIFYFRCETDIDLLALVNILEDFVQEHQEVKLIVIDSIAFHFRYNSEDMSQRTRLLSGLAQDLLQLADSKRLAVVLTNQMTTRIENKSGSSQLIPALGESWGHMPTIRILLFWEKDVRHAKLIKAPNLPTTVVSFQVTTAGIRDVPSSSSVEEQASGNRSPRLPSAKRKRDV